MDLLAVVADWVVSYRKCSTGDEKMNRRCWLISWRWRGWCSLSDLLLLSSSITTCCWRTELFRRGTGTPTKPVRTLKCQLLMFWKLYLIRNYLRIPRHPRCRRRGRDLTPLTRNAAQPQTPPPSPTLMPTISSQSSLKDTPLGECQSNTRSGRTSNSNAKTVVRWGTTIGVVVVVVAARILLLLRRRLLQRTYYCIRITNCLCARWSLWSPDAAADDVTDRRSRRSTWSRNVQGTLEFGSVMISRIVWTGEWLICRIEQSKLSAYLFHRGAFGQSRRGRGTRGRREGAGIREGNRLGLITMIET